MNSLLRSLAMLVLLASSQSVHAQQSMHREVAAGEVTGLEMSIEGSLQYQPGQPFRWWVRLFEVVHRRDIRPAPRCTIRATAPFAAGAPVEVSTGQDGRALITIPVPTGEALQSTSEPLIVEATCPRGVRRVFDVALEERLTHRLQLIADRPEFTPGAPLTLMGRLLEHATGRGTADIEVSIRAQSAGQLHRHVVVRTDRAGFFTARFEAPRASSQLTFTATAQLDERRTMTSQLGLSAASASTAQALELTADPARDVVGLGEEVEFTVHARSAEGVPIEGASVRIRPTDAPPVHTDAYGVARLTWRSPAIISEALVDETIVFEVHAEGYGSGVAEGHLRIARQSTFASVIARSGALVPGLPARIYLRVVDAGGHPRASESVVLSGASIGANLRAVTDAEGLAFVDVPSVHVTEPDACGGSTSTQLTIAAHGATIARCLPVDPDAPLRVVTAPRVDASRALALTLHRRSTSESETVLVTVLRESEQGWEPVASAFAPPHATTATVTIPPEVQGLLWVRARLATTEGQDLRAGSALTWLDDEATQIDLRAEDAALASAQPLFVTLTTRAHAASLQAQLNPTWSMRSLSTLALEASLAGRVPLDIGASAMLRAGQVVPQALPDAPITLGLLRDPWRTRARFVRGRIGRLMLAVETIVEESIPARLDEVGVQGPRGWTWNREMLDTAVDHAGIDDEGSAALDGEPLDIDALVALDPSFTFDNVARRITRKRLWDVIVAMRNMTHEQNLDLPWAHRGDPATWISSLVEDGNVETNALFDAWGHPFVMRRTQRTSFLPAVPGWEVASAGPDGVIGSRDDMADPFVRVLPATSLYAEAVGENALIARLSRVALGRAFVFTLDAHLGGEAEYLELPSEAAELGARAWDDLPAPIATATEDGIHEPSSLSTQLTPAESWRPLVTSRERTWTAIAFATLPDGNLSSRVISLQAGTRFVFAAELPSVMRVGDQLNVPFHASSLHAGERIALSASTEGAALEAQLTNPSGLEGASLGHIALHAASPGAATLTLRSADGAFTRTHRIRVLPSGVPLVTRTSLRAVGETDLAVPAQQGRVLSQTLILATPQTLHHAQLLDAQSPENAAILAWAGAIQGDMDEALLAPASSVLARPDALTLACALVATATAPDTETQTTAMRAALAPLARSGDVRARAATLLALTSLPTASDVNDPVANTIRASRLDGWRAIHVSRADPNAMAMMAAALLVLSPEDETGRTLYEASLRAAQVVPASVADARIDTWLATLARGIAARQLGLEADANAFANQAMEGLALLDRAGTRGAFWLHAAAAYGALGAPTMEPMQARLTGAGAPQTVALQAPVALEIAGAPRLHLSSPVPLLAVLTQRVLRVLEADHALPIETHFEGTLGASAGANARSVLDLVITSTTDLALGSTTVELQLPTTFVVDATARAAIERVTGPIDGPDLGNVIRLHLPGIPARTSLRIPMALRRVATGSAEGLGVIAYEVRTPAIRYVSPNRIVTTDASIGAAP